VAESIFEFAGGESAFQELAAAFHARCLAEPILSHPFSHPGNPLHVQRLGEYWTEVFGGPPKYSRDAGGHSGMLQIHGGEEVEDDLGTRFVACFDQAAEDVGLPGDAEFRTQLHLYMEWAVAEVLGYSRKGAVVPPNLETPRWGWNGLEERVP
jgi:hemoglobin